VGYRALVNIILVAHFGFLVYLVLGGFLAWRWPWALWPHAAAAVWGLLIITFPVACPLTWAEDWARRRAGEPGLTRGFMDRYVNGVLYPIRYEVAVRLLVAAVVLLSWIGWYLHRRRA
jgi:hypothetical protein